MEYNKLILYDLEKTNKTNFNSSISSITSFAVLRGQFYW